MCAGMMLNKSKCRFGVNSVEFLSLVIDEKGIHADPRLQGVLIFPTPKSVSAVRSFLGLANRYAELSECLSEKTALLRALLKKDTLGVWSQKHDETFQQVKDLFKSTPVPTPYSAERQTIATTDAIRQGLGATLGQIQLDGTHRLLAVASRSLTETEQKYAAIEFEGLCACWAMERFSQYILGMKNVLIETDHRPLITIFGKMFLVRLPPQIQALPTTI